jgi:DNA-binding LacI/PurR family transcriptional regulator
MMKQPVFTDRRSKENNMATLYDVCDKSGFSTATVSRVINDSGLVTEKTRDRVLKVIEELNYRPSHAARLLAGQKTDTIGVILPVIDDGYCVQVLRGIDQVLMQENLKMIISSYRNEADLEETIGSLCGEGRANALIMLNKRPCGPTRCVSWPETAFQSSSSVKSTKLLRPTWTPS